MQKKSVEVISVGNILYAVKKCRGYGGDICTGRECREYDCGHKEKTNQCARSGISLGKDHSVC